MLTEKIRRKAIDLGFDLCGVAAIADVPELGYFADWLAKGYAGEMAYLQTGRAKRQRPSLVLENARTIIIAAKNYNSHQPRTDEAPQQGRGWISRYAWGQDYHKTLKRQIKALYNYIRELTNGAAKGRYYVDTGPVLEKTWAKYAGIGWQGKNTCLISQRIGSYFFIAAILTDLDLKPDMPAADRCGSCTRCLDACPTQAFAAPYVLDARRCISYLTIEKRGTVPESLRAAVGRHLFGCDICQDVCPWNRKAPVSPEPCFQAREGVFNPEIRTVLAMTDDDFRRVYAGTPVKRAKYCGMIRNALIAAANSGIPALARGIRRFLSSDDAMLREHAQWALTQLESHPRAHGAVAAPGAGDRQKKVAHSSEK